MKTIKITPKSFASNSYILTADGKTAVVIDPAEFHITDILRQNNLECEYVLLTHGHFDHIGGCGKLYEGGAKICCGKLEKDYIFSLENKNIFGGVYIPEFEIFRTFDDGEVFELCGIKFKAIFTPGHTEGSVCYLTDGCIFTGDTLFFGSVGRCDLPTGNALKLNQSLKNLASFEGDFKIYSGHGEDTTLDRERKFNPYLRSL